MQIQTKPTLDPDELRRRAEARFQERLADASQALHEADAQRLIHELQVHQIELEMQNEELQAIRRELEAALAQVKQLTGLVPICANCKRIRDNHGNWTPLEVYIEERSEALFTHGMCPPCVQKFFPGIDLKANENNH